jgi:uncharacterized protein (DUF1697 family)
MAQATYIFLIRGINVSGHKIVKMDALRKSFEKMGLQDVRTYVQSGNVVARAPKQTNAALEAKAKKQILKDFGYEVSVIVRSANEIEDMISANPFLKESRLDPRFLHITFLSGAPDNPGLDLLKKIPGLPDRCHCAGPHVYLYCPGGYGQTKFNNNAVEKALSRNATTRNWNTVSKLREIAAG